MEPIEQGGPPDDERDAAEERRFLRSLLVLVLVIVGLGTAISIAFLISTGGR